MAAPVLPLINDTEEIAQGLAAGGFAVLRWELVAVSGVLDAWKEHLAGLCTGLGVDIDFIDIPAKSLTVIVNLQYMPFDSQIHDLISAVDQARWEERS